MSERNEAVVRRIFEEVVNRARYDLVDELYLPTFVDHDPLPGAPEGPEGVVYTLTSLRNALPDLRVSVNRLQTYDDKVLVHNVMDGMHLGRVLGFRPTQRRVTLAGQALFRLEDGLVAERWARLDLPPLARNLFRRQSSSAVFDVATRRIAALTAASSQ